MAFQKTTSQEYFYIIHSESYRQLGIVLGCVQGAFEDFQRGFLGNVQDLLRAEIFSDFLKMEECLLQEGYKDAAVVIIGSVLEDSLRKLALRNSI